MGFPVRRSRWFALVLGVVLLAGPLSASPAAADPHLVGRSGLPWNAAAYNGNGTQAPRTEAFGDWRGRPVDYMLEFATKRSGWSAMDDFYDDTFVDFPGGHIIAIPSQPVGVDEKETAAGRHNAWWENYGSILTSKGLNKPTTILRLNWEMNIQPWGVKNYSVDTFVKAYNNVVTSVKKTAPNVRFTFGMSTGNWPLSSHTWQQVADLVGPNEPDGFDYVELDGYDHWPAALDDASWQAQHAKTPGRAQVLAYAQSRQVPMWIGEWGVSHATNSNGSKAGGGDNPYFVQRMHEWVSANAIGNGGWIAGETTYNETGAPAEWDHELYDGENRVVNPRNADAAARYRDLWGGAAASPSPSPPDETSPDETSPDETSPAFPLLVSASPDRSDPRPVQGATLDGTVYVFADVPSGSVTFSVDDTKVRTENIAPYDLAGTNGSTASSPALPYDLSGLPAGQHTITATHGTGTVTGTFTIDRAG